MAATWLILSNPSGKRLCVEDGALFLSVQLHMQLYDYITLVGAIFGPECGPMQFHLALCKTIF